MAAHAADLLSDQLRLRRMQRHNRQYEPSFSWPHVLELHEDIYAAAGGRGSVRDELSVHQHRGNSSNSNEKRFLREPVRK
jgi:hypothetical protein